MIELSQTSKTSIKFDRMIPSGSSWLMGLKTQRLVGQAHAVIEPGKRVYQSGNSITLLDILGNTF